MKNSIAKGFSKLTKNHHLRNCLGALSLGAFTVTGSAIDFTLDSRATYLRVEPSDNNATASVPIDLGSFGISAGDTIRLAVLGDFDFTIHDSNPDSANFLIGVFSSSATLLGSTELNRVPGAIDAGTDAFTGPTLLENLPSDIPEDFSILDLTILVPQGANFLFVAASDTYYGDNADADNNFGVSITAVPDAGSTAGLFATALSGLSWCSRHRRAIQS